MFLHIFRVFVCLLSNLCGFQNNIRKTLRKTAKKQTKEPLEDDIKSGSGPAEKNNSKKYTFEYVKIHFFGRTKGGALLKYNKKTRKRDERGRKTRKKKRKRDERG